MIRFDSLRGWGGGEMRGHGNSRRAYIQSVGRWAFSDTHALTRTRLGAHRLTTLEAHYADCPGGPLQHVNKPEADSVAEFSRGRDFE